MSLSLSLSLVFHRPHLTRWHVPPSSRGYWAGTYCKITWCYFFQSDFNDHVDAVLKFISVETVTWLRYGLWPLAYFLSGNSVKSYCSCLFFLGSISQYCTLPKNWWVFKRLYRYGFTNHVFEVQKLLDSAMRDLLTKIQSPEHCLHPLLLPQAEGSSLPAFKLYIWFS